MSKVKSLMTECGLTNADISEVTGLKASCTCLRIKNKRKWTPKELVSLLKIFRAKTGRNVELWDIVDLDEPAETELEHYED